MTLLLLALLACPPPGVTLQTEHYDLYAESVDAADTGAMLEALHADLKAHFGSAPAEKLRLEVYATREAWESAMRADGLQAQGAGGFYSVSTKKAYLWVQPSAYFTRQLILHEATHQFHYLAATGNRSPTSTWYTEGLAEYFGMHNWDGKSLKTGVVPSMSLEDYPKKARAQFAAAESRLDGIGSGHVPCDRPLAWALVHFLVNRHPDRFRALSSRLDAGKKAATSWKKAIAGEDLSGEFQKWLDARVQAFEVVWISWDEKGEWLEGGSEVVSIAACQDERRGLKAELEILDGPAKAGLMFGYTSPESFWLLQVLPEGKARVVKRENGGWKVLATEAYPEEAELVVEVKSAGAMTVATVNGGVVGEFEAPGRVGLNAEGCRARFRLK